MERQGKAVDKARNGSEAVCDKVDRDDFIGIAKTGRGSSRVTGW